MPCVIEVTRRVMYIKKSHAGCLEKSHTMRNKAKLRSRIDTPKKKEYVPWILKVIFDILRLVLITFDRLE